MNFENSKTYGSHRLLPNLSDKINLKRNNKFFALSNLSVYCTWKTIKKNHIKTIIDNCNWYLINDTLYHLQHGIKYLNFLMGHFLYQIFKIILNALDLKTLASRKFCKFHDFASFPKFYTPESFLSQFVFFLYHLYTFWTAKVITNVPVKIFNNIKNVGELSWMLPNVSFCSFL